MQNILIVAEAPGYLIISLTEKLKECSYHVQTVSADVEEISKVKETIDAIFIYGDEEVMEKQQAMNYIKDRASEDGSAIFLAGQPTELKAICRIIPEHMIQKKFQRPINVNDVAEEINQYIKKFGSQNKKKILVVDDSGAMLRNVKGWLEDRYQVILANSGAMAIKYLALNRPDLVLLDYEMPVVDGKQVLEMIRTETEFNDIPVIFLTSKGDKESVMKVMALKPEGYLLKTMEPAKIIQAVDDFFEKQKAKL